MKKLILPPNLVIALIIVLGFSLTTLYSFLSFQQLFKNDVEAVSELTSENIFANINNLMDRPMNVSLAMANDTFLRDFIYNETSDEPSSEKIDIIQSYLASYQKQYEFDSVFFVSTRTNAYYHFNNGIDRYMERSYDENIWYYDFLASDDDYSLNVDNDEAKDNVITIFVNCKLYDDDNNVLGVVGVGLETPYIQHFLSENEKKYGTSAYLIDDKGNVQLSSGLTEFENVNLADIDTFEVIAEEIVASLKNGEQKWYHSNKADGYIVSRYVPNLNWYLVVEKGIDEFQEQMTQLLIIGFVFVVMVVFLVIMVISAINKKNKEQLVHLARIDQLTGTKNRTSYEEEIKQYNSNPSTLNGFGIGVFDLNRLKYVNDSYGHQSGDLYIKTFSGLLSKAFPTCSVFRIGGDEFVVIFSGLTDSDVQSNLQKLSEGMSEEKIGDLWLSAAYGYAFYDKVNLNSVEAIFKRADNNMYSQKANMKLIAKEEAVLLKES